MPLYEISTKGSDKKRLVEADTSAAAIRFCSHDLFSARTITKPADIARLMGAGIALEKVGDAPAQSGDEGREVLERVNVLTGMFHGSDDSASRPASLDELVAADPSSTFRVDVKSGMVQRLPTGGDTESGWEDLRAATADEIKDIKKK
jgi:hypothetical protein